MELLGPSKTSLKITFVLDSTEVQIYNYNIVETDWGHNRHIVAAVIQAILTPGGPFLPTGQATLY